MKIKYYFLTVLILITSIFISVVGYIYKDTAYADFYLNTYPSIAAVFKAANHDIFPWTNSDSLEGEGDTIDNANLAMEQEDVQAEQKSYLQVDDSYFDDALFIGDSRMVGLSQYCQEIDDRATFFALKSLTIYDIENKAWIKTEDGQEMTLWQALDEEQYSKIYLMVGINEIGTGNVDTFIKAYSEVIDKIRFYQPNAYIFINSIMHVSEIKDAEDSLYNNTNINLRNDELEKLADNIHIFYQNMNEAVDDENGNLKAESTSDGIHLKGNYYEPWHQYLLSHGI